MSRRESSNIVPHELLLGQAGFLRRLAGDLLRDPHAADDAVQDVWLAALEHPPAHAANVRGWLSAVLKNLVSKRLRSGERRSHHEREAGRSAGETEAGGSVESEATLRFVTEAVLALDEPYRSAILLRYFENLSVREIARRESVPLTTMKSRLRRALDLLRARMERERRADGRSFLSSLVALAQPKQASRGLPLGTGTGILLMSLKTKIALGCAAALLAWVLVHEWTRAGLASQVADSTIAAGPQTSVPADHALTAIDRASTTRVLVATPEVGLPAADASATALETLVYGSLFGGTETTGAVKLPSAWVRFADANGQSFAAVEKNGDYSLRGLSLGRYWIRAGANGWRTLEEPFELESAHPQVEKDIHLRASPSLSVFVRAPDGRNLEPVVMDHLMYPDPGLGLTTIPKLYPVATRDSPGPWIAEVAGSANNYFGVGLFLQYSEFAERRKQGSIGVLLIDGDLPVYASLVYGHAVLCTEAVAPGADEVDFVLAADALESNLSTLKAHLIDASTREPLRGGALVDLGLGYDSGGTGPNGVIMCSWFKPGLYHATISKPGYETLMFHLQLDPGRTNDLGEIALEKGLEFPLRVLDCAGAPCRTNFNLGVVDPMTMALEIDDNRDLDSDEHGELVLRGLGRKMYVLRTINHDASGDGDPNLVKSVSGNLLIDLRAGSLPSNTTIRLQRASRLLLHLDSQFLRGPRFRVIDDQGVELVSQGFYGSAPRPLSLPAGAYRIEVLDADGAIQSTKSVTLGATPILIELGR